MALARAKCNLPTQPLQDASFHLTNGRTCWILFHVVERKSGVATGHLVRMALDAAGLLCDFIRCCSSLSWLPTLDWRPAATHDGRTILQIRREQK